MTIPSFLGRTGAAFLLVAVPLAHAHVGLEWPAAFAGSVHKLTLRITHGCGASPTRQVSVDIPAGVRGARPQPRPGWSVAIERAPLPTPETRHGRTVTDDVVRITWTAQDANALLDAAHFGEFALLATLPAQAGPLTWPVRQRCVEGSHDWVQRPAPGQDPATLTSPAPVLEVLPASPATSHVH